MLLDIQNIENQHIGFQPSKTAYLRINGKILNSLYLFYNFKFHIFSHFSSGSDASLSPHSKHR